MKKDLNRAGGPKPLRRTAARTFSVATKQQRFPRSRRACEACGELIGNGMDWRQAVYHHIRLVSDVNVSDKEARSAANCIGGIIASETGLFDKANALVKPYGVDVTISNRSAYRRALEQLASKLSQPEGAHRGRRA